MSELYLSEVGKLVDGIVSYLAGKADFSGVAATHREAQNFGKVMIEGLDRFGALLVVFPKTGKHGGAQTRTVFYKPLVLTVEIYEDYLLNQSDQGTRKHGWWLAERAQAHLNYLGPRQIPLLQGTLLPAENSIIRDVSDPENKNELIVQFDVQTNFTITAAPL